MDFDHNQNTDPQGSAAPQEAPRPAQDAPQNAAPEAAQSAPQAAASEAPQSTQTAPQAAAPDAPQSTQSAWQDAPQADASDAPQSTWQSAPQAAAPDAPQSTQSAWQDAPQADAPDAPQSTWQSAPQADAPDAPQSTWQSAPQADAPDAPQSTQSAWQAATPDAPQSTQSAPQAATPDAPQSTWQDAAQPAASEPRTPYQTPVREDIAEHYASYEAWRRAQQQPQPQAAQPEQELPNFSTYEEWQRQQKAQAAPKKAKKPRRSHKKLWISLGSVAAACLLLVTGVFVGTQLNRGSAGASASGNTPVDPSKPTLKITDTASAPSTAASGSTLTGEQVYEKVSPSVVSVVATSLQQEGSSSGSGVVMTEDGYIITNHHVIDGADKVTIVMADGMQHNVTVIGSDAQTDLAVLKTTEGGNFTAAEFGDSAKIRAGEKAYAIGSPGGVELANTITTGSISAISRDITIEDRVMTLIQTDASINPGNSGGALINQSGQVIGITSAKLGISYYEGLGFAIPIDTAKQIVDQLIAHGYVPGRPSIGITGYNLSQQAAQYNEVPQGVVVTEVTGADAMKQGLQANDIIIAANGTEVTTMNDINKVKENFKAGDKMTLTVYRLGTGKTLDITITLADANAPAAQSAQQDAQQQQQIPSQSGGSEYFTFPW